MGYEAAIHLDKPLTDCCWWSRIWKIHAPLKQIITLWLDFNNKLLNWESLLKRGFNGPGYCVLCRAESETNSHLFFHCTYVGTLWKQVTNKLDPSTSIEDEEYLEHKVKNWWNNERACQHEALPALFVFTIWETRNREILKKN